MVMQGQQATISWSAIDGADSYTLQRKSSADTDWTQVYSGTALTYSETVGTWTSLQYRVCAVFGETSGGWATSDPIQIVSASALVISGQDGDLGTLVNDVPFSISSDQAGVTISATVEVNGGEYDAFTATSGQTYKVNVLDLPTGTGSIVITATTTVSESPVTVTRTWTYSKTAPVFPNAGNVGELTEQGVVIWLKTLDEAVRTSMNPWGGNLGTALELLKRATLYNRTQTPKYSEVTISMANVTEGQIVNIPRGGVMTPHYVAKLEYESGLNGAGRRLLVPVEAYGTRQWASSYVTSYAASSISSWMDSSYKALFPENIQTAMGTTTIYYTPDLGNVPVSTMQSSIFLLSATELGFPKGEFFNIEGTALPIANTLRACLYNGQNADQWTRTIRTGGQYAYFVYNINNILEASQVQEKYVRPCFTLPSTFTGTYFVDQQNNVHDAQEYEEAGTWSDVWGNEIPAVKIATGSYVGTGTTGANNPNTLTFQFDPKIVVIYPKSQSAIGGTDQTVSMGIFVIPALQEDYHGSGYFIAAYNGTSGLMGYNAARFLSESKTLNWYCSQASQIDQLNYSGITYYYVAIG